MERMYERLVVWQKSRTLAKLVYELVAKFPRTKSTALATNLDGQQFLFLRI